MKLVFQGHGLVKLLIDLIWPILLVALIRYKSYWLPTRKPKVTLKDLFVIWVLLMCLPNATYAFFEIKHLILIDKVADNPNIYSYLVFAGIALTGLISTVYIHTFLIKNYAKTTNEIVFLIIFLSLLNGFGTTAGLLDFYSRQAIVFPPIIFMILKQIFTSPQYLSLAIMTTILFYATMVNLLQDHLKNPR